MRLRTVDYVGMIEQFMKKYGQVVRYKPTIPSADECNLRFKLIAEEVDKELLPALQKCYTAMKNFEGLDVTISNQDRQELLIEISDAAADTLYVVFGMMLSFGLPIEAIFAEVHRSNMSKPKLGHDKIGQKVEKGNYSRPQIAAILEVYKNDPS